MKFKEFLNTEYILNIRNILIPALILFIGALYMTEHINFSSTAHASSTEHNSAELANGDTCYCASLTGVWIINTDDSSSDDSSSADSSSADDTDLIPGYCQCTAPGSGTGAPPAAFQAF